MSLFGKEPSIVSKKLRASAKGQSCTIAYKCDGAWGDPTVVLCHSPFLEHGKATGYKGDDIYGCFGCSECHAWLDGNAPKEHKLPVYLRANRHTMHIWIAEGLISIKGHNQ